MYCLQGKNMHHVMGGIVDTACVICKESTKTSSYMSFHCKISRAIWFGYNRDLRTDTHQINSPKDIINFVPNPQTLTPISE